MDYYLHIIPGQIRIKTSALQTNEIEASMLNDILQTLKGIKSVIINKRVGSVLIHYERGIISSQRILNHMALRGLAPAIRWDAPKIRSIS